MKNILIVACCILSIVTAGAIISSTHYASALKSTKSTVQQLQAQSQTNAAELADDSDAMFSKQQTIDSLQKQMDALSIALTNSADQLTAANNQIQSMQLAEQNRLNDEENKAVPPPVDGVFSKVIGVHGETLAVNATFGQIVGRKVIFRPENQMPISIDVESLHPLMLKYLGINLKEAIANQQQMDAAWSSKERADQAQGIVNYRSAEARQVLEAKMAVDQQNADSATQQAAAAQAAAWAAQQQAIADKERADAALIQAQNPPQVNVIQQTKQVIY